MINIQVRFKWTPHSSGEDQILSGAHIYPPTVNSVVLWDNRITQHIASWHYQGSEPRHGTRVTSLAEKPTFDRKAPSRREALGLDVPEAGLGAEYASGTEGNTTTVPEYRTCSSLC